MNVTNLQLLELQIPTLFCNDLDSGRLRYIREPGYEEAELDLAPRFFMGRTGQGNIWRFRYDLPDQLGQELQQLCITEPISIPSADNPYIYQAIRTLLQSHVPITEEYRGPAYWIPENISASSPVEVVLISEDNASLLEANFPYKLTSRANFTTGPFAATIVDGKAVSICYCARLTGQAAEAGVETVPGARGHGYASSAVMEWARAIRSHGLLPLYSTSWDNLPSQGVARNLGLIFYGEDWWIS